MQATGQEHLRTGQSQDFLEAILTIGTIEEE
jgi:hypothetical protein